MTRDDEETQEKMELLWKVITRLDYYIGTTNAKAAMITAFNVFVLGGIVIKWNEIIPLTANTAITQGLAAVLLAVASIASLFSLWKVFSVINPFLDSPREPKSYHSDIFFGHISEYSGPSSYLDFIKAKSSEETLKDLAYQSHVLATGVNRKFSDMAGSVKAVMFAQLPALTLLVVLKLITAIYHLATKG